MTLAKQAIVHFFQNDYWTNEEVNFLHLFCIRHDSEKIWKLKLRVLTLDNNDLIVAAVLADASPEEFKFLYNKYHQNGGKLTAIHFHCDADNNRNLSKLVGKRV